MGEVDLTSRQLASTVSILLLFVLFIWETERVRKERGREWGHPFVGSVFKCPGVLELGQVETETWNSVQVSHIGGWNPIFESSPPPARVCRSWSLASWLWCSNTGCGHLKGILTTKVNHPPPSCQHCYWVIWRNLFSYKCNAI